MTEMLRRHGAAAAVLAISIAALYGRVIGYDFVKYDDHELLVDHYDELVNPGNLARVDDPQEDLADRVGEQQPVGEVDEPVEHVALEAERRIEREAEPALTGGVVGHERVGVVRADLVQREEHEHHRIRYARETEPAVGESERGDRRHRQRVLEQPVLARHRRDREHRELEREQRGEHREEGRDRDASNRQRRGF